MRVFLPIGLLRRCEAQQNKRDISLSLLVEEAVEAALQKAERKAKEENNDNV